MKSADASNLFSNCIDTIYESDIDDENFSGAENSGVLERRRKSHTEAEQRRRNAIKSGFEALRELVYPRKNSSNSSIRISKISTLNKTVADIRRLGREAQQKQKDVEKLEKTAETLRFINSFYENRTQEFSTIQNNCVEPVPEEIKLQVFQIFSDMLFTTFDSAVALAPFPELFSSILDWLENKCHSAVLSDLMDSIISMALPPIPSQASGDLRGMLNNYCPASIPISKTIPADFPSDVSISQSFNGESEQTWTNTSSSLLISSRPDVCIDVATQLSDAVSFDASQSIKRSSVMGAGHIATFRHNAQNTKPAVNPDQLDLPIPGSMVLSTPPPQSRSNSCFQSPTSNSKCDYEFTQSHTSNPAVEGGSQPIETRRMVSDTLNPNFPTTVPTNLNKNRSQRLPSSCSSFKLDHNQVQYKKYF
ncbi:Helix-loop-helix DNA-binding domain protein [Paragonimus heterotremus]|uniref:Helix-loop-helix DNA-binding domain protein n=1 Tax=Paragonimus heterotremus TaxID=100268 RepID=A0A8J4SLX2_9TREM|nr:Helix-loop-helix DNA-binding domain protein [Paragonimus heterotremus]